MEQLKKDIKVWLETHGFSYHEANSETPACWYKTWWVQNQQVLIINGERQENPPMQVAAAFNYEDEPGWTSNPDGSCREEFLQGVWMLMEGPDMIHPLRMPFYNMNDFEQIMTQFGIR